MTAEQIYAHLLVSVERYLVRGGVLQSSCGYTASISDGELWGYVTVPDADGLAPRNEVLKDIAQDLAKTLNSRVERILYSPHGITVRVYPRDVVR